MEELETFYGANTAELAPAVLYTAEDNAFQTEARGRFLVEALLHCADVSNVAKPLRRTKAPLLPVVVVPVLNEIPPLTPLVPALEVRTLNAPLLVPEP